MKKWISLLLMGSLLGLVGCNDKQNNVNTDYRVEGTTELKVSQLHQTPMDDKSTVHQVIHARFEKEKVSRKSKLQAQ